MRSNGEENQHNMTVSSSIGDITIDSVKDHLGSGEDLNRRISGLCVTKTVTTIVSSNQEGVTSSSTTATTTAIAENTSKCSAFCVFFYLPREILLRLCFFFFLTITNEKLNDLKNFLRLLIFACAC